MAFKLEFDKDYDKAKAKELELIEKLRQEYEKLILETKELRDKYVEETHNLKKKEKQLDKLRNEYESMVLNIEI